MASAELQQVLQMLATFAEQRPEPGTGVDEDIMVETLRSTMSVDLMPLPEDLAVRKLNVGDVPAEWLLTPGVSAERRLLYIHGGGFIAGGIDSHRGLAGRIGKATGCAVLIIDYRLAPEHKFPAGVDDCVAAARWIRDNGPDGPSPAASYFIAGDSAGGCLTLTTLLALRDAGERLPDGAVALSALTDFTFSGDSIVTRKDLDPMTGDTEMMPLMRQAYLGDVDPKTPLASPLFGDLAGLPPLLIQAGDHEVLLDDSVRFAEKAKRAGIDVTLEVAPEMFHVWQYFAPMLPEGQQAIDRIGAFVQERAKTPA
jgi:epsilon-lactone hydrolase